MESYLLQNQSVTRTMRSPHWKYAKTVYAMESCVLQSQSARTTTEATKPLHWKLAETDCAMETYVLRNQSARTTTKIQKPALRRRLNCLRNGNLCVAESMCDHDYECNQTPTLQISCGAMVTYVLRNQSAKTTTKVTNYAETVSAM